MKSIAKFFIVLASAHALFAADPAEKCEPEVRSQLIPAHAGQKTGGVGDSLSVGADKTSSASLSKAGPAQTSPSSAQEFGRRLKDIPCKALTLSGDFLECVFHRDRSGIEFRLDGSPLDLQDVTQDFRKELESKIGANFLDQSFEQIFARIKRRESVLSVQKKCDYITSEFCYLEALGVELPLKIKSSVITSITLHGEVTSARSILNTIIEVPKLQALSWYMKGGLDLPRVPENCNVTILGEAPYLRMPSLNCFAAGQFGHSENTPRPVLMYAGSKVGWNAFPTMNEKYDFCCGAAYFEKSQNPLGISGVKPFEGKKNKKKKPDAFLSQGKKVRDHVESLMGKAQEDLRALVMGEKRIDINDVKFIDPDQPTTQDICAPGVWMSPSKKGYAIRYEDCGFAYLSTLKRTRESADDPKIVAGYITFLDGEEPIYRAGPVYFIPPQFLPTEIESHPDYTKFGESLLVYLGVCALNEDLDKKI